MKIAPLVLLLLLMVSCGGKDRESNDQAASTPHSDNEMSPGYTSEEQTVAAAEESAEGSAEETSQAFSELSLKILEFSNNDEQYNLSEEEIRQLNSAAVPLDRDKTMVVYDQPVAIPGGTLFLAVQGIANDLYVQTRHIILFIKPDGQVIRARQYLEYASEMKVRLLAGKMLYFTAGMVEYDEDEESGSFYSTGKEWQETRVLVINENAIHSIDLLSKDDLRRLRNRIFAWHGRTFKSPDLQEYFNGFDWYQPVGRDIDEKLSEEEKEVVQIILDLEK